MLGVTNNLPPPIRQQIDVSSKRLCDCFWRFVALPISRRSYLRNSNGPFFRGRQSALMKSQEGFGPNNEMETTPMTATRQARRRQMFQRDQGLCLKVDFESAAGPKRTQ